MSEKPTTPSDRTEPTLHVPHTATMFFNSVNREVMRITASGQLIPGEGLSQDEATQGMFAVLQKLFTAHVAGVCREKDRCIAELEGEQERQRMAPYDAPIILGDLNTLALALDNEHAPLCVPRFHAMAALVRRAMALISDLRATLLATQTALEQAKADTVRLDWLDASTPHIFWSAVCNHPMNPEGECAVSTGPNVVFYAKTYRAAIDAASAQPKQEGT